MKLVRKIFHVFSAIALLCLNFASLVHAEPYKNVRDWYVSCTYSLTCQLYTSNSDQKIWSFGFERGPGANAPVTFFMSTNLTFNEESDLAILIDDKDWYYLEVPKAEANEGTWRFPGQDADGKLRDAMRKGRKMKIKIEAAEGDLEVKIPLSGVTGSMLFADEAQGRIGNQDALEAKGNGTPVDAITRAMELKASTDLPEAVRQHWEGLADGCSEGFEENNDLVKTYGGLEVKLKEKAALFVLPCGLPGAYNYLQVVLMFEYGTNRVRTMALPVMGQKGPTVFETAYNLYWDDKAGTLSSFFKGRGLGDCGLMQTWELDDSGFYMNFELIEERRKDNCDERYGEFPVIWPIQ